MDDVIYRQAAIDALTTECSWTIYDEHGQLTPNGEEILGTLKKIPSAQKKGIGRFSTDGCGQTTYTLVIYRTRIIVHVVKKIVLMISGGSSALTAEQI